MVQLTADEKKGFTRTSHKKLHLLQSYCTSHLLKCNFLGKRNVKLQMPLRRFNLGKSQLDFK